MIGMLMMSGFLIDVYVSTYGYVDIAVAKLFTHCRKY